MSQLADAGVAAIVFLDTAEADRPLLEQAAAAAEQHALPVLSTPPQHTAEMVDVALHRHLAGRREALLRRSQELQQEFTALAFAGRGLPAIVERLATITGLPAAWEDRSLELRGWATPPGGATARSTSRRTCPTLLRGARLPLLRWAKTVRADATPDVAVLPLRADSAAQRRRHRRAWSCPSSPAARWPATSPCRPQPGGADRRPVWPWPGPAWPPRSRPCAPAP